MADPRQERKDIKRLALASAVFLSAVVPIYTATTVYSGNVESFAFGLKHLLPVCAAPFLALALALSLPAVMLRGPLLRVYAYFLCFLAFAAWLYSSVLMAHVGLLDGSGRDFSRFAGYRYYEIAAIVVLWLGLYGIVIKRPRAVTYLIVFVNLGLAGFTAWSLVQDPKVSSLAPRPNLDALTRFSSDDNVLIVLMDAFQSDVFQELLDEDPALAEDLAGFTFFPDTLGVAASTYLTLPSIHTGQTYEADMNIQEFYSSNVRDASFLNDLAAAGHEVTLVNPLNGDCPTLIELCIDSDQVLYGKRWSLVLEAAFALDIALLRAVPFFYKKAVYNDRTWRIRPLVRSISTQLAKNEPSHISGNQVLERLRLQGHVAGGRPVTKFLHLLSTHRPYVQDSDCNIVDEDRQDLRLGAKHQSRCALAAFRGLLEELRRKGLYDRSLILLIADTGAGLRSSYIVQVRNKTLWRQLVGRANPIFLAKAPGATGKLRVSTASIQPSDVAATVCAITLDCGSDGGISVFDTLATSNRPRLFWHYTWRNEFTDSLPDIRGFELTGPIWDRESWLNYTEYDRGRH